MQIRLDSDVDEAIGNRCMKEDRSMTWMVNRLLRESLRLVPVVSANGKGKQVNKKP